VHMHPDCSTKKIRGTFPKHLRDVNMHLERLNQQISKLTKITPVKSHNKLKKIRVLVPSLEHDMEG